MIIRPADIDDARAIATIHVRSWQHAYIDILPEHGLAALSIDDRTQQWSGWLQAENSPTRALVAEKRDVVVGFAAWGPNTDAHAEPDTAMLYSIYLHPDHMGEGIGSQLLEAVEVEMIAEGYSAAELHVLEENTPTRWFYENLGWKLIPDSAQVEHFFEMSMTTVRYRKALS